ncbi:hypothetical protein PFAG_04233 [Plasmodium falciparum Santa Lucia]|nr:hypothetical protein PFAG_04233 [Plasmodium falciparum Santa Lucia]
MSPNVDEKSSTCECTDINNIKLGKTKGRDKYLKHLKHRCIGGICSCTLGSALLTYIGTVAAKAAIIANFGEAYKNCIYSISILNMLTHESMYSAIQSVSTAGSVTCSSDLAGTAAGIATGIFYPCGIAALVLLILTVVLIILYIWLYRRRKRSWKHECKKHLCK